MRIMLAMGAMPAIVIWAATPPAASDRIEPRPVKTQRIVHQIFPDTFRNRWDPVADLPPAREVVHEPLLLVSHETLPLPNPKVWQKKVAMRTDTCARHGMRKKYYHKGRWQHWRCVR
jgi:hypothetical protein